MTLIDIDEVAALDGATRTSGNAAPIVMTCILAITMLACATPMEGDPCEPDPYARPAARRPRWDGFDLLECVGPAGCGPDVTFHYRWLPDTENAPWVCRCNGESYMPDVLEPPTVRWRYYGHCEGCDEIEFDGTMWGAPSAPTGALRSPVRPECIACGDARRDGEGQCVGADGSPRAAPCCDCHYETVGTEQVCIGVTGEPINLECCES